MNSLSEKLKNYLIVVNSSDYLQELYKLCLESVKNGCLVLLITAEHYDFSKLLAELTISKDQLKNFIIMYYDAIDDISRKLLLLHSWSLVPSIVAVDLSQLLRTGLDIAHTSSLVVQKVALCTVSLLAYLETIAVKLSGNSTNTVYGLLILSEGEEHFLDEQIQTLKDLYFYGMDLHRNFDSVRSLLKDTGGL